MMKIKSKIYGLFILLCLLVWGTVFVLDGNEQLIYETEKLEHMRNEYENSKR